LEDTKQLSLGADQHQLAGAKRGHEQVAYKSDE
jgi:hypothetical protein